MPEGHIPGSAAAEPNTTAGQYAKPGAAAEQRPSQPPRPSQPQRSTSQPSTSQPSTSRQPESQSSKRQPSRPQSAKPQSSKTNPTALRRTGLLVTLILGGLTATPPLAMDMYLPALPEVTDSLHAPATTVQLTLTACLAGMALGQLLIGPMSDRFGRRRPLLLGLAVYIVATALCALAPTIETLIAFRLVQGLGQARPGS